jgi:predicted DCC family thiol-disulfide oxidoreductase YuxK
MIRNPGNAGTDVHLSPASSGHDGPCNNRLIMKRNETQPLVLFDGVCNLCESTVLFIIRRDKQAVFRFAALQSAAARELLREYGRPSDDLSSVLLVADGRLHRKADAGLQIARRLDGAWPLLYYLFCWIPRFIADRVYDFIGARRYRWFGMKQECWIPTADLRQRFIDDSPAAE